jgi:hypothetical protein
VSLDLLDETNRETFRKLICASALMFALHNWAQYEDEVNMPVDTPAMAEVRAEAEAMLDQVREDLSLMDFAMLIGDLRSQRLDNAERLRVNSEYGRGHSA